MILNANIQFMIDKGRLVAVLYYVLCNGGQLASWLTVTVYCDTVDSLPRSLPFTAYCATVDSLPRGLPLTAYCETGNSLPRGLPLTVYCDTAHSSPRGFPFTVYCATGNCVASHPRPQTGNPLLGRLLCITVNLPTCQMMRKTLKYP